MRILSLTLALALSIVPNSFAQELSAPSTHEHLWYEAENMRGLAANPRHEPMLNPSWRNLPRAKAPGWGINGPGVSAEWTQGGESEWNSAAASADEVKASLFQDIEIPRAGDYKLWVRYADWARKNENFVVRIVQNQREVFRHEFGAKPIVDPHDEVSMYWGWAFTWDGAPAKLDKGPARLTIEIEKATEARRHVDCFLLTTDAGFIPVGRQKPEFAAWRYLRAAGPLRSEVTPLTLARKQESGVPMLWQRPEIAGADFSMPWNIAKEFWPLYEKPESERPLYPFAAESVEEFVKNYTNKREVPIFSSKLVTPVIYLNDLPALLKEGSPFLRYLRETKSRFAILINYGSASFGPGEGQAAWSLLTGELRDQFLGWISGESVGYVWDGSGTELKISPAMSRRELLEAHRVFYTKALADKWSRIFQTTTGPMWKELIPAQSTSSTSFAHALSVWGVRLLGIETAAVQPMFGMRIAFTRGAVRQFGGGFLYYHAPNFGDSASTFTKAQNFAGPDNFFHSRYGVTMGPSLSWYRKSYYVYYMAGASAIYLEQGYDQFFKPGPGENPYQLNPLGRITDEFVRFAEKHPNRGTPYTPVAFLLDPAHGWEMTDYPHWPFGVSQISRSDRALRELFGVAYYPGTVLEGEPATADRQAFVSGIFGDIFDVLVAQPSSPERREVAAASMRDNPLTAYRAVVVGGDMEWSKEWADKLATYVRGGGTVVLNSAQVKGLPAELLGVTVRNQTDESDSARCLQPGEAARNLAGQSFRYDKLELRSAQTLMQAPNGDPIVATNKFGEGRVILLAVRDLLGHDERITPFAAHLLEHVFAEVTPVKVTGDAQFLINRTKQSWVVTLINNNGVHKPQQGMATVDRTATVNVKLELRNQKIKSATDWIAARALELRDGAATVELAPGAIAIVELTDP